MKAEYFTVVIEESASSPYYLSVALRQMSRHHVRPPDASHTQPQPPYLHHTRELKAACGVKPTLCAEEFSRDVKGFASDDNDLLSIEELLGDNAGETTEKVSLAVDNHL
jgi:hypothetical protein